MSSAPPRGRPTARSRVRHRITPEGGPLLREERVETQLDAAEIGEPDRDPERPGEQEQCGTIEMREIVEQRVGDGREAGEPISADRRGGREGAEPIVLPARVFVPPMREGHLPGTAKAGEAAIPEERADDDLQLDRIGRQPPHRHHGALEHNSGYGTALRAAARPMPRSSGQTKTTSHARA